MALESSSAKIRILIIDDDPDWRFTVSQYVIGLEHFPEVAESLEDAKLKILEAEKTENNFSAAILDMNFEIGKTKIEIPQGQQIIKHIKTNHPYIACILLSGSEDISPDFVLDLRDEYDLDYCLDKNKHFSIEVLSKAIEKATRRITPIRDSSSHIRVLRDSLEKWKGIYELYQNNHAAVVKKKALKGDLEVDVGTQNEIDIYENKLNEAILQIEKIQKEIDIYESSENQV